MTNKIIEDNFEKLIVKQFNAYPGYMKQILMDEFNKYQKTNNIRPLMAALRYAIKSKGYTNLANEYGISRDTIYNFSLNTNNSIRYTA